MSYGLWVLNCKVRVRFKAVIKEHSIELDLIVSTLGLGQTKLIKAGRFISRLGADIKERDLKKYKL